MKPGGPSLFKQTLLGLIGALLLSHLIVFLSLILFAENNASAVTSEEVTTQLDSPTCSAPTSGPRPFVNLQVKKQAGTPDVEEGMVSDPLLTLGIADALSVPVADIHIAWPEGSEIRIGRTMDVGINGRNRRIEGVIFVSGAQFARHMADGWCVYTTPQPGWLQSWRIRTAIVILLSFATLLPLAWLFARRLSRPIARFADAADRIGSDSEAPPLREAGPQELRTAARALNDMHRRIQQQMREREAMAAAIAHDLRTPLSRIAFRIANAPDELSEPVQRDIEQMNAMIGATIEHSRRRDARTHGETVLLCDLLKEMVAEERATGHSVGINLPDDEVGVDGDAIEIRRMVQNLLDNARRYGPPARLSLSVDADDVRIVVTDQGPGISEDRIEDMMAPFTRGEPSRNRETGGVGLGLSIARAIARKYGGELNLSNGSEGGLVATIRLPRPPDR